MVNADTSHSAQFTMPLAYIDYAHLHSLKAEALSRLRWEEGNRATLSERGKTWVLLN